MTDEVKALVERLRNEAAMVSEDVFQSDPETLDEAADLIETQAREIERLRRVFAESLEQREGSRREIERLRIALHEIDVEASNTIPPDGKDAAFAALFRIAQIINPFRLPSAALAGDSHD